MRKFEVIKSKWLALGVKEDNIDYAITSVIAGTKREFIIETLTASYRGMNDSQSNLLLEDLFEVNGGEFKKENRSGYSFGILLCLVGLVSAGFLIGMIVTGEWKIKVLLLAIGGTIFGLIQGPVLLSKAIKGKYRDTDDPI